MIGYKYSKKKWQDLRLEVGGLAVTGFIPSIEFIWGFLKKGWRDTLRSSGFC